MTETASIHALPVGFELLSYKINTILGQGGFGITYLATDKNLNRRVAIKEFMPVEFVTRDQTDSSVKLVAENKQELFEWGLQRFRMEARTLAQFKHPNVVQVLSLFDENNTAYMVMEYEQGTQFGDLLKMGRDFTEKQYLRILLPILDGLKRVHEQGFIHRDIKPTNIYLRKDGTPVLLDFGSARRSEGAKTQSLTSLVTHGYAPFEQYNMNGSDNQQGPWTDIYSFAATIYHAISAEKPCDAMNRASAILNGKPDPYEPLATNKKLDKFSKSFLQAIDKALSFKSVDRPQSVAEWSQLLVAEAKAKSKGRRSARKGADIDENKTRLVNRGRRAKYSESSDAMGDEGTFFYSNKRAPVGSRLDKRAFRTALIYSAALIVISLGVFAFVSTRENPMLGAEERNSVEAVSPSIESSLSGPEEDLPPSVAPITTETKPLAQEPKVVPTLAQQQEKAQRVAELMAELEALANSANTRDQKILSAYILHQEILKLDANHAVSTFDVESVYREVAGEARDAARKGDIALAKSKLDLLNKIDAPSKVTASIRDLISAKETELKTLANKAKEAGKKQALIEKPVAVVTKSVEDKKTVKAPKKQVAAPNIDDALASIHDFKSAFELADAKKLKKIANISSKNKKFMESLFSEYRLTKVKVTNVSYITSKNMVKADVQIVKLVNKKGLLVNPSDSWSKLPITSKFDAENGWRVAW